MSSEPTKRLDEAAWPVRDLGRLVSELSRRSGLCKDTLATGELESTVAPRRLESGLEECCAALGVECVSTTVKLAELETRCLGNATPAVLLTHGAAAALPVSSHGNRESATTETTAALGIVAARKKGFIFMTPNLELVEAPTAELHEWLQRPWAEKHGCDLGPIVASVGLADDRQRQVVRALVKHRLEGLELQLFALRPPTGDSLWQELRRHGVLRTAASLLLTHILQTVLWLGSWWLAGRALLTGSVDRSWLLAWGLLLVTLLPLRLRTTWLQGEVAIRAGLTLKQRLLDGALKLVPDELRHQGASRLLGIALEAESVETQSLNGGLVLSLSVIELAFAVAVLAVGAGGRVQVMALLLWIGVFGVLTLRYTSARRRWTADRLSLTHFLVENLLGYKTRLAQQPQHERHVEEETQLGHYHAVSRDMDRRAALVSGLVGRGWLVVALLALIPAMASGVASTRLAVALGGILLAFRAFRGATAGILALTDAQLAWQIVAPVCDASRRREPAGLPRVTLNTAASSTAPCPAKPVEESAAATPKLAPEILAARHLVFRYPDRDRRVLEDVDLSLREGGRVLLCGPSGGGKSTLISLLAVLERQQDGLLLLGGYDAAALGHSRWRREVVVVPQFHENHVLTETFAFNLLLGRGWPPTSADLEEALTLCQALGLGNLLERMPSGLFQRVGETGWQLSHGERNRLFLARALLQRGGVFILDENFAALDAENLERSMRCVLERAPSLIVVAHP